MEKTLEIITLVNNKTDFEGAFTEKEEEIIKPYMENGLTYNFFSGNSKLGTRRFDLTNPNATDLIDVFDFIETQMFLVENSNEEFITKQIKTVLIDSPYNEHFAKIYNKKGCSDISKQFIIFANCPKTTILFNYLTEFLKPTYIIIKSWNYYIPKGYGLEKGYLCYPGGYRKSTLLLICKKL